MSGRLGQTNALRALEVAASKVARIERDLAAAKASRDDLIRLARRDAGCPIADIQSAAVLSRPRVNQILAR